jgi:prepilin-type N-terminal cleavage/methylation domain-containing protein
MKIAKVPAKRAAFTLVEIMIVLAILGLLISIAIPNFVKTRTQARKNVCIENLSQIESAKQIWGVESGHTTGDLPTDADLIGPTLYIKLKPRCPSGGGYDYMPIGRPATCTENGHEIQP